jgi:predicted CopG family antitoxin
MLTKTIRVSEETYQTLSQKGSVADTFDDVIKKLLKPGQKEEKAN